MDWLDFLAVPGTLKSLLQYYSSKASILLCSAFFIVQLSHSCMTIGKTIAFTRWTFVGKLMSLLFTMLSRWVITFLPRSRSLLISWLQSPSAVILELKKMPLFPHLFAMRWWDRMSQSLFSECWVLSQLFHSPFAVHYHVNGSFIYWLRTEWRSTHTITTLLFVIQLQFLLNRKGLMKWNLSNSRITHREGKYLFLTFNNFITMKQIQNADGWTFQFSNTWLILKSLKVWKH